MTALRTHYEFTLPKGYVDGDGTLHRDGVMRLATARDEIEPLRDARVADNEAYLTVLVLSRVVTELGAITPVAPSVIEGLFAADLAFLQDLYGVVNFGDPPDLAAWEAAPDPLPEAPEPETAEDPPAPAAEPSRRTAAGASRADGGRGRGRARQRVPA